VRPKNLQDVDLSRVEAGVWWGAEDESEAEALAKLSRRHKAIARKGGRVWAFSRFSNHGKLFCEAFSAGMGHSPWMAEEFQALLCEYCDKRLHIC